MKGVGTGLVGGLACAVIAVACARQVPSGRDVRMAKLNEITSLWTQIRDWRREAKLPLEPTRTSLYEVQGKPVEDAKNYCPANHVVPKTCNDVCDISDAICDNSERICTLADELGKDDSFAQEKCTSSKASCKEAQQKCCKCSDPAPE